MYQVILSAPAKKDLTGLDVTMRQRIAKKLVTLADTPRSTDTQKLSSEEKYRVRVGTFRIVYTIDDQERVVTINRIEHRREVYR
jgi:mRNA interferase RelE/StbE